MIFVKSVKNVIFDIIITMGNCWLAIEKKFTAIINRTRSDTNFLNDFQ